MPKSKSKANSFKKGRQKTGGRKAGVPNKSTKILEDAFLKAAEAAGNKKGKHGVVSYLTWVAIKKPASFMPALARMIAQQLETKQISHTEELAYPTVEEVRQELIKRGVPVDLIYPALTDETDKTDKTDKTDDKTDKTDDDPGEQQR